MKFANNLANLYGGAIHIENEACQVQLQFRIVENLFEGNRAALRESDRGVNSAGGAVAIFSTLRNIQVYSQNNTFRNNQAQGGEESQGGAVYLQSCIFSRTTGDYFE